MSLLMVINAGITGPVRVAVLGVRILRALVRDRAAEISPRNVALAEMLPWMNDLPSPAAQAIVARLVEHDDPYVRAFGLFARAVTHEINGETGLAEDAEEAYRCFEAAGDHWGMGMAAQGIGNSVPARTAGTSVEWLRRSVRHMELIGAAQDARSVRVLLDIQLALAGDADAERRLHDTAEADQAQDWDHVQAYLGLANLAWQRHDLPAMQRCAAEIARSARDVSDPQPRQRVLFRIAAAILLVAAGQPRAAATVLAQARDDMGALHDTPVLGAWAIGGALLAQDRGDLDVAGELWALGIRTGASLTTMFTPDEFTRMAAPLANEDHRRIAVPDTGARIRELMARIL